ncbi:MAG: ABC-2 family transporter protein [Candidatus Nanoarchaeia archaeon]|nr:ABC-2 family transporter protein [Candidatus Nanoarchaeia archaeon]
MVPVIFQMFLGLFLGVYLNGVNPAFSSANEIMVYYFFSNVINNFQRNSPVYKVENEVISGNINIHLVKPYNFIFYILVKDIAVKIWKLAVTMIITFSIFALFYNINIGIDYFIRAFIAVPLAVLFINLNVSIFCYLSMIFEKIRRVSSVYGMLSFFLGGGLVSVKYFPEFIKYLPQYFYFGAPLDFIINSTYSYLPLFLIYTAIFIFINLALHKIVTRRIETNG